MSGLLRATASLLAVALAWENGMAADGYVPPGALMRADEVLGNAVLDSQGVKAGEITDIAVDLQSGAVGYVVVSPISVLGRPDVGIPLALLNSQNGGFELKGDAQVLSIAPAHRSRELETPADRNEFASRVRDTFHLSADDMAEISPTNGSSMEMVARLKNMGVRVRKGESLGRVEAVMLDFKTACAPFVVIFPSGALNATNLIALPPGKLMLTANSLELVTDVDPTTLASAPSFPRTNWALLSTPAWAVRAYQHFGVRPTYLEIGERLERTSAVTNAPERIYHEASEPPR